MNLVNRVHVRSSLRTGSGRVSVEAPGGGHLTVPRISLSESVLIDVLLIAAIVVVGMFLLLNQPSTPSPNVPSTQPGLTY